MNKTRLKDVVNFSKIITTTFKFNETITLQEDKTILINFTSNNNTYDSITFDSVINEITFAYKGFHTSVYSGGVWLLETYRTITTNDDIPYLENYGEVVKTLSDFYIFTYLKEHLSIGVIDFIDEMGKEDARALDLDYFYNRSLNKPISSLLLNTLVDDKISLETLKNVLLARFKLKWNKLYDTLKQDYNLIENYDRHENLKTNSKIVVNSNGDTSSKISGFNSIVGEDDRASHVSGTTTTEADKNYNFQDNHIHGNIGVTTAQQMLSEERELWLWEFLQQVYKDIDSISVLKVH